MSAPLPAAALPEKSDRPKRTA